MHYNHGVIWRRTDIFVKLNLPMQKQDVFLYLSKCWSSPHRESLENVVVRSFPKGVRPCFITAVEAMGVTPLQLPGVPLKCCKRTTETSSFHFIITITWLMQEGAMGGCTWTLKTPALFRKATGNPCLELTDSGVPTSSHPSRGSQAGSLA